VSLVDFVRTFDAKVEALDETNGRAKDIGAAQN
jgi:hypothetical protein